MALDYDDFDGPDGQSDNPGGTAGFFYYAPKRYFDPSGGITKPADIGASGATLADLARNSDDFTFLTGKGFHKMYVTFNTGDLEAARQGELDGYSFMNKFKGFIPGFEDRLLGFWRVAKNDRFLCLFPMADRVYLQYGDDFFDCYLNASKIGTATNSAGHRGTDIEAQVQASGVYIYDGAIVTYP